MSHTNLLINILFLFGSKWESGHKYALLTKEMTHDIMNVITVQSALLIYALLTVKKAFVSVLLDYLNIV